MDSSQPAPLLSPCRAHKFGGSSLADAERIRHVAGLLLADDAPRQLAVSSAMHGTTNALIALADAATAGGEWRNALDVLRQRHRDTARALLEHPDAMLSQVDALCGELAELLQATSLLRQPGRAALERIHGMGELLSTALLHAHLVERGGDYALLDAREVLVVRHTDLGIRKHAQTSPASSPATNTACRPRWAAMAATIPPRSSPACSRPTNCTSGATSMACFPPIRGWCPRRCRWRR